MDLVIRLLEHLLYQKYSIDRIDSIITQLNISKIQLLQIINDEQYKDFFQILQTSNNSQQSSTKLALTLDLFCCTHYGNNCKNQSCPFIHLCPYHVRPKHEKCTNKNCSYDHDVLSSQHNRRIIDIRNLSFLPGRVLYELIRASTDPNRSFWVCNDFGKKNGCLKGINCDKLHYCYFLLIDNCTKSICQHTINEQCLVYFQMRDIHKQEHQDILHAFRKVLRQRRADYVSKLTSTHHSSSSPPRSNSKTNPSKLTNPQHHHDQSSLSRITTMLSYVDISTSKSEPSSPSPVDDQDILLVDDNQDYKQIEQDLSREINCQIKLLISKQIHSEYKNKQITNSGSKSMYYYCPVRNSNEIFDLLRWQNNKNQNIKPLIVYANIGNAHSASRQFSNNNQYCLLRVHLFHSDMITSDLLPQNSLQLNHSFTMCFDRMWIYIYKS